MNLIYLFFQKLFWRPWRFVFSKFFDFKIESEENLNKLKPSLIIASNHSSWIDSFLVATALPFDSKLYPIRFACWHKHYYKIRNFPFVVLFGAFPIKKGIGLEESLKKALKSIKSYVRSEKLFYSIYDSPKLVMGPNTINKILKIIK